MKSSCASSAPSFQNTRSKPLSPPNSTPNYPLFQYLPWIVWPRAGQKKPRLSAVKSREETPKEGIYSQRLQGHATQ
ncbi:hypothetical protein AGR8A_Lc20162 [Agrobacterium fabrum str. J-07]|nr:hypothetical protein AGR8A_Lc20162 [Agrobacterium fabrum str. J-07]